MGYGRGSGVILDICIMLEREPGHGVSRKFNMPSFE